MRPKAAGSRPGKYRWARARLHLAQAADRFGLNKAPEPTARRGGLENGEPYVVRRISRRPAARPAEVRDTPPAEAIEAAAFDLFARQGFQVTTVRDVMRACGLTQGALYNH